MNKGVYCVTGYVRGRHRLLQNLVDSVRISAGDLKYRICVVDNNSQDGAREWMLAQDDIDYIDIGDPRGSKAAFQKGFENAPKDYKYVVTMNDDVTMGPDSLIAAYECLEKRPDVGQIAFRHSYQNRPGTSTNPRVQGVYGYPYAQCGMTRKWLGDYVGWCGEDGYVSYGWDNRLSLAIWELGYKVIALDPCIVIDYEHDDEHRQRWSRGLRLESGQHPDTRLFHSKWFGRLPLRARWVPKPSSLAQNVVDRAVAGQLRTMRFKSTMRAGQPMRSALISEFRKLGPAKQVDQTTLVTNLGMMQFQYRAVDLVKEYKPDLLLLQAQRINNVLPATVSEIRAQCPNTLVINWDGDTHYPLEDFHFEIAKVCHLQLVVSPSLFEIYRDNGVRNIGYWPIGVEYEYLRAVREKEPSGPDVVFLGALYGEGKFPEAETRRDSVIALSKSGLSFAVYGGGWKRVGIESKYTGERHMHNARIYAKAGMSLSVSQTAELWGYSSDRLYNITCSGCPALMQAFPGMEDHGYVDGRTCISWVTIEEMLEKAKYYTEHKDEREAIARAGRDMARSRHTWEHRVEGLMTMLEDMSHGG